MFRSAAPFNLVQGALLRVLRESYWMKPNLCHMHLGGISCISYLFRYGIPKTIQHGLFGLPIGWVLENE